ncbi:dol-P-Man:Man(5)GlcNAc(2)-PP-Dol alpha-1,3-mannosyltransferase [Hirsutella rhossiliensis]|uniref:Dol-P-Man:Man(5)GlcNAc(2)-PP-Dol alpha-1,3-mannosyltransferase n=1 Tax=Hirsutella rhossiliensis TaxID=111463 RepID=A0A9P8SH54_9HYPO|nr:dol-P-Man:Man(5)GlcNAc(2)-PP-Dol alpha-1,3-mannosyltransferase [Hirsutella rhossiliensis]KAH0961175.1 dol-P-Man:Man(5)GlcNAc(2)-PP-Dol alpha-1,3-mannosyltransferase [Hirsutella rhossiliensis]
MSKLSPSLKALINAPSARPGPVGAPQGMRDVYERIAADAARKKLGTRPWLAISAAATFTLNSPDSLAILHGVASADRGIVAATQTAELMRDVGLKCISFNGIPRTINCLNAFRAALPPALAAALSTTPERALTPHNLDAVLARGRRLFDSVYAPLADKLVDRLARAHPDLPVHILASHYAPLLADPPLPPPSPAADAVAAARTGRLLTSAVAVACLRAQTGVGPQVLSHVYGLRKAVDDGSWRAGWVGERRDEADEEELVRWLAGDEGSEWILKTVDSIVEALGGSSFAAGPGRQSKL